MYKNSGEKDCEAAVYVRFGILYRNAGRYDSAVYAYLQSARLGELSGGKIASASAYNQLGSIYYEMDLTDKAMAHFLKAYDNFAAVSFSAGMADVTHNIASLHFDRSDYGEAEKFCNISLLIRQQSNDTLSLGYNYDLLARILQKRGQKAEALRYSDKAVKYLRDAGDNAALIPALLFFSQCNDPVTSSAEAIRSLQEAYLLSRKLQYRKYSKESAVLLAKQYYKIDNPDSAYRLMNIAMQFTDSLHDSSVDKAVADAVAKYDTEKKDLELQTAKLQSTLRERQLTAVTIAVVILSVLVLLMIQLLRQRRKNYARMQEIGNMKARLNGQEAERERIARELHDRVGSMLSTTKLMLSTMEDPAGTDRETLDKTSALLDETYDEVRRISHDLDTGLLIRVGIRAAISQLLQTVATTRKINARFIDNEIDEARCKPYARDLYRITQELLNNTIKHAEAREISVQLSISGDKLIYSYEDDGKGFATDAPRSAGMGLSNIEARVKSLGGFSQLDTSPGNGLNLIIEFQLK